MTFKNFTLTAGYVDLMLDNGTHQRVFFNRCSGHVYYRFKIGTLSDVKHTGIHLGNTADGSQLYMHNHYSTGKPAIVSEKDFSQGCKLYPYVTHQVNTPLQVIHIGLQQIVKGESYNWLTFNCQSYVNVASCNVRRSEDVSKWAGGIIVAALLILGIRSFNQ